VQNPLLMRVVNRLRDCPEITGGLLRGQRSIAHELREVLALDVIHREEMVAVVNANLMDGDDVGMLERRRRRRFGPKPMDELARSVLTAQDQLQGNCSSEVALACAIHHAHSAPGNLIQQFVAGEYPACRSGA
jgi:hypothetical protein